MQLYTIKHAKDELKKKGMIFKLLYMEINLQHAFTKGC